MSSNVDSSEVKCFHTNFGRVITLHIVVLKERGLTFIPQYETDVDYRQPSLDHWSIYSLPRISP